MKIPDLRKLLVGAEKAFKEKNIKVIYRDAVEGAGKKFDEYMSRPHRPPKQSTIDNLLDRVTRSNGNLVMCPECEGHQFFIYVDEVGRYLQDENGNVILSPCPKCNGEGVVQKR